MLEDPSSWFQRQRELLAALPAQGLSLFPMQEVLDLHLFT